MHSTIDESSQWHLVFSLANRDLNIMWYWLIFMLDQYYTVKLLWLYIFVIKSLFEQLFNAVWI